MMYIDLIEILIWRKLKKCRNGAASESPALPDPVVNAILGHLDTSNLALLDALALGSIDIQ